MANFDRSGMTQAGINLMGKAIGGATIQFTKLVLGDGEMTGEILDLQGVVSPKQNVDVTRIERNDNQCTVGGELLTSSVKQGFWWREIGLYAMDPDKGEILYNYASSSKPDWVADSLSNVTETILVAMIANVGSANIDITINDSMVFATKSELTNTNEILKTKAFDAEVRKKDVSIMMSDLHTEVKSAMTGGSVAVVGLNTVGPENIKEKAVTSDKKTVMGEMAVIFSTKGAIDISVNYGNAVITIPGKALVVWRNQRHLIDSETKVDFSSIRAKATTSYCYFNVATKTFCCVDSSQLTTLSEDNVLFAVIPYDIPVAKPCLIGSYTLEGNSINYNSSELYTPPILPPADGSHNSLFNYATDKSADVYKMFDNLQSLYPKYIKRIDMGYDSSGTIPIFHYIFRPEQYTMSNNQHSKTPTSLILGSGIHGPSNDGDNKISVYALYWFLRDLCTRWETNDFLAYLRWNVTIFVMPIQNPWGFDNNSRYNSRGVDINRNFDCNWNAFLDEYKGSTPFSERETQLIKMRIEENTGAIFYADIHSRGGDASISQNNLCLYVGAEALNSRYFGQNTIGKLNHLWTGKYGLTTYEYGSVVLYSDRPSSYTWAAQKKGMDAANPECFARFGNYPSHSSEVVTLNTQYIGNLILSIIKYRQINNK